MFLIQAQLTRAVTTSECKTEKVTINGIESVKYNCNFKNPITSNPDLCNLIKSVVAQVRPFAITLVSLLIIIYGFRYVLAAASGNEGKLKEVHKQLGWLLLGAAIVGGAVIIIGAVVKVFSTGPPAC